MTEDLNRARDWLQSLPDPLGFLSGLAAHLPVGLAVWSTTGHVVLVNKAYSETFAVQPGSGDTIWNDATFRRLGLVAPFERALRGESVRVPAGWYDASGNASRARARPGRVAVAIRFFPLSGRDGQVEHVAAVCTDETATVMANERLQASEDRMRLAQQVARVGTFEWDVRTNERSWTPQLEALYGFRPGELQAGTGALEQRIHPDDRARAQARIQDAFDTLLPIEEEWRVVWPDGSIHWVAARFQLLRDAAGAPHRMLGANMDITARKASEAARRSAEGAVRESEADLRTTLDSIGDGVIATDELGRVVRMNPVAQQLTGWTLDEARGRELTDVFRILDEANRQPAKNPVFRVLREGTVVGLANHTLLVSRDGTERAIADTAAPIRDAQGALRGVVLVFGDQSKEREAARALQRSEARFRRLSEAGLLGILIVDFEGNILEANQTFLDMVGYTSEEVLSGKVRWADMTPPEWRYLDDRAIVQLQATGVAPSWEKEYTRKDGTRIPILVGVATLDGSSGECVAFALDLTEQKRVQQALRISDRRFRGFYDSGVIGIAISDRAGAIKEANDAFLAIVGYTRDDLLAGRVTGANLNTPERDRTDAAARAELRATGVAHAWEKELVRSDGTRVPVLSGVVMLEEATQEVVSFILDLTEQKRAQAAARESEARKAAVMEAALDAVILIDADGVITEFNAAAERTFGYSREEAIGASLAKLIVPPALREAHTAGIRRYLQTGEQAILGKRVEVPAMRKDGSEFPAEVAVVRIRAHGAPVFTGYVRDITDRREAAEAQLLRREKDAAEAANRELEAFSYSVAHDLRAPLRGISGFSGALLEDYGDRLDAPGRALIQRLAASASRMGELIDGLLSLARLSRTELRRETVSLTDVARSVLEQLRSSGAARSAEIEVADGLVASGDPRLLRAVLENLLGNAWKFTRDREPARIELGSSVMDGNTVYHVSDNGVGFDMAHTGRLFAPFHRLHREGEFEGTGIGLATVQRIILRHGGRIWAEGRVDHGATFRFTLADASPATGSSR
jgi:PAS domain S-box-containing protein